MPSKSHSISADSRPARLKLPLLLRLTLLLHAAMALALAVQPSAWRWVLAAFMLNHLVLSLTGLWPRSQWLGPNWTRLPAASAQRGEIALTIDDGPDPEVTPAVLDLLDRLQVKASFFCIGEKAQRHPALCREIVARGHDVQNHSERHRHNFSLLGPRGYRRELQAAQDSIAAITGHRPQFFRAPAGLRNPFLGPVLARMGLRLAAWTRRGYDTRSGDADVVSRRLLPAVRPGAILLMHDGNCARSPSGVPVILDVLPGLVRQASASGLRFVTLSHALQTNPDPHPDSNTDRP
jgi:peptidoglycan/xylan/chitin deacetylase (PgdA/CDA1 family)